MKLDFRDRLDAKLLLDGATGWLWAVTLGLLAGFSLRECAERLGVPLTTITRKLRRLADGR